MFEKVFRILAGISLSILMVFPDAFANVPQENNEEQEAEVAAAINEEPDDDQLLREAARKYRKDSSLKRQLDNQANFESYYDNTFNVTPDQLRQIRRRRNQLEEAGQLPVPSQGVQRSQSVSLDPGAKNAVIRCYPQYATVIRVLDNHGNPWPIMAHMIGNSANFQVQKPDMEPYDTIIVSPVVSTGSTNLALMLDNNDGENPVPPLSLQLIVSPNFGKQYDSVASIRVNRRGPRAGQPVGNGGDDFNTDDVMLAFLDGVPPKNAVRLKTNDKSVEAWEYEEMLYIRSPKKIIWPAWQKTISSGEKSGQTFAYELPMVPSVMFSGNKSVNISRYPQNITRAMEGR